MNLHDFLIERSLSKKEKGKQEKIVKGMKKSKNDFKDRYGKDAEAVMYATATKLAKESVKSSYDQGGKSWYELQDAKALAKKDGKNPDRLSYGELSSYIEKARKARKDEDKQRLDPKCWKGYKKQGTKMKGGVRVNNCVKEAKQALARHVKEGVPLPDSLFRYQSEAYFDTFKYAKQLREAGILQELDWESEEMLATDIGESVELKGVGRVWLDVPYLDESIQEAQEGMIGEPDGYYDEEERRQAYNDLQDALAQSNKVEAQYVIDGHCPECPNVEDDEDCYGFGNYGCDEGELTYNGDTVSWKEIKDHDERQAQRQQAKANYPGDEKVIKGLANMMKNMDDPRQAYQQMQADYPQMGRAQRSNLIAKAKQMAFPESVEIDQIKKLAGLNELKDERTDIQKIEDLLKDAIGPDARGEDMYELYAELESMDSEKADEVKLIAKEMYNVRLEEGKSPHKKGTKKYKKHMAAMHAEAVRGRPKIDGEATEIQKIKIGGVEREFIRKGEMWHSTDPM